MARATSVVVLAGFLVAGAPAARAAEVYDYAVDRVEVDGNVHGLLDGTPDLVEEFDDGVMGPTFVAITGTSAEEDGALRLRSPGPSIGFPGMPTRFDTSAVVSSNWLTGLRVGSGDMILRMVLPPQAIGANDGINLLVQSYDDTGLYYTGVSIMNFNSRLARRTQPPVTPGLAILSHQEVIGLAGFEQLVMEDESILGLPLTGDVVLELHYHDATQTFTPRYSLDGGATFVGAFFPLPLKTSSGTATFYLAAVAHEGECPAGVTVDNLRLRGLDRPGYAALSMRVRNVRMSWGEGRIVITDDGAGGATLVDAQLPDTLVTTPTCGPRDGWSSGSGRYRYRNVSGAMPPDCMPGSAAGFASMDSKIGGESLVKVKVKKGTMAPVVGPLRVAFYGGTGPVNECDGNVGVVPCIVKPGAAKCSWKYASE